MANGTDKQNGFGQTALEMNYIDREQLKKARVVQARIFERTQVKPPISDILIEMGAITIDQRDEIRKNQDESSEIGTTGTKSGAPSPKKETSENNHNNLDIEVSSDKLTATILIHKNAQAKEYGVNDVKLELHSRGIVSGIAEDKLIAAFLQNKFSVGKPWTIATGTEAVPESPPEIEYQFDTDPIKIGTMTENGFMDWKNRGQLPQVKEGDLLAQKKPGQPGKPGMDVYGKIIPIPKPEKQKFICGKGARRSEDGLQVHATLSGIPKLSLNNEISVMQTLFIEGDVSIETGHVEFDGHIEVSGAIEKGYRVKGGSLRAKEIRNAQIEVDGDITALNGIFGATIKANGNMKAGHVHNANITLAGDLAVEKEIIDAAIEINGRCLINDGIILSSTIAAKMGIVAMDIGNQAARASELVVGIDKQLEREENSVKTEMQGVQKEQEERFQKIKELKRQSDEINTTLGEVAQKQDKCMVQHRSLQERLEAGLLAHQGAAVEKIQETIRALKAKQDAYDQEVNRLMDEDEAIGKKIAGIQKEISETKVEIESLTDRLLVITEARKTNLGIALVKVGGTICSGTRITGPNAVLVLDKDLKRLSIMETNKAGHDGTKNWHFELGTYR